MGSICKNILSILSGVTVFLISCKKIIHIDLNNADSKLVIDADMSDVDGLKVYLSKSVGFYEDNVFPTVDNAVVVLLDMGSDTADTADFVGSGEYTLKKKPVSGTSYKLIVQVDTSYYTAIGTMPEKTTPDSITFAKQNVLGESIISAKVNFKDKAGVDNYYLFKQYILKKGNRSFFPFSDRLSDGLYIRYNLLNDSAYIAVGDSVCINMECIDKNVYTYFYGLENISADDNGFASTSPSNPPSNIVGDALGIFNVHSQYTKTLKVPDL